MICISPIFLFENNWKGNNNMREYSLMFNSYYETNDVVFISNMMQNAFYMKDDSSFECIVDIFADENGRVYFVWKKNDKTKELYKKWCANGKNEK